MYGHSLRVTGAQGLARLGLDLWAIQLFGRWDTEAVQGYVRLVSLEHTALQTTHAARSRELAALVTDVTAEGGGTETVLEQAVSQSLPVWVSTTSGLSEPLWLEVVAASPLPPVLPWVRNASRHGSRGVFHLSSVPLEGARLGDLKSRCGWRFGHIASMVTQSSPPRPWEFFFVCKRCAKCPRASLFEAFSTSMDGKTER